MQFALFDKTFSLSKFALFGRRPSNVVGVSTRLERFESVSGSENSGRNAMEGFTQWVRIVNKDGRCCVFVVGFTFFVGGLFALGPIFTIVGLVCLIVSLVWCYRIKPLENKCRSRSASRPKKGEPFS